MASVLQGLNGLPAVMGMSHFLSVMRPTRLFEENEEHPQPDRPLRTIVRIIFTAIAFPFFALAGGVYNLCAMGANSLLFCASLVAPKEWRLSPEPLDYAQKGLCHFLFASIDLSLILSLPVTVLASGFAPNQTKDLYLDVTLWIREKTGLVPPVPAPLAPPRTNAPLAIKNTG